jgi:hypothetical protein
VLRLLAAGADVATIIGAVAAFRVYGTASRNARRLVQAHLDVIGLWAAGPKGSGWSNRDITLEMQIGWLDPTHTVFRQGSGPALIQMTMGDKITLGPDMIGAIVTLNQALESFNAVLNKVETVRAAHARDLALAHTQALARVAAERTTGRTPTLDAALGPAGDDLERIARITIKLLTMLHAGLIGGPGGDGLHEAYRAARAEFDR